jgi:hypothetical protein
MRTKYMDSVGRWLTKTELYDFIQFSLELELEAKNPSTAVHRQTHHCHDRQVIPC